MRKESLALEIELNHREREILFSKITPMFKSASKDEVYQGNIYHTDTLRECKGLRSLVHYLDNNEIVLFLVDKKF